MQLITNSPNPRIIIHKDDEGRIDRPVIKTDDKGIEFTYDTAMRYMRKHKMANDGMQSGWFTTTYVALGRAKWATE